MRFRVHARTFEPVTAVLQYICRTSDSFYALKNTLPQGERRQKCAPELMLAVERCFMAADPSFCNDISTFIEF